MKLASIILGILPFYIRYDKMSVYILSMGGPSGSRTPNPGSVND